MYKVVFIINVLAISFLSILEATIVIPTLSSSSNLSVFAGGGPENLINNSGLLNSSGSATTLASGSTLAEAQATRHIFNNEFQESYVTTTPNGGTGDFFANNTPAPTFLWDLGINTVTGEADKIDDVILWNYQNNGGGGDNSTFNGNGARLIEFTFSNDMTLATPLLTTTITLLNSNDDSLTQLNGAQTFSFDGIQARYVQLRITDNYFGQPGITAGGDRVGLGELRFNVTSVPEPSSAILIALGASFFLRHRRISK